MHLQHLHFGLVVKHNIAQILHYHETKNAVRYERALIPL